MRRQQRILPKASIQLPGKGFNHQAKMDVLPCSSHQIIPLNEKDHQSKALMMPCLNENQDKIKIFPYLGHRNISTPSSCFKNQTPAIQLPHAENQTMTVFLPDLDHDGPTKPIDMQASHPKHWVKSTILPLPFPDSRSRTVGALALPCSENWIPSSLSPDLWNKASLDSEHLPRIPQIFDHWAENVQHLNYWSTISPSPDHQNEVISHIDCRPRAKTIASLIFDYWAPATDISIPSHRHKSKVPRVPRYYKKDITSPLQLQGFGHQHKAKGTPLPCPDPSFNATGEPNRYHRANTPADAEEKIEENRVKSRLNFNKWVKAPEHNHWVTYPLGSKNLEPETKLVPDQMLLSSGPEHWIKMLPDSNNQMYTKILTDPEYQAKSTEVPLGPSSQSNDELGSHQRAKFLLAPIHQVESALYAQQQQIEDKTGPTTQVHFASGLNHKIRHIRGSDYYIKHEPRSKEQDGISSGSDFQMKTTMGLDQRVRFLSYPKNLVDTKHRDTHSQNPNHQVAPYSGPDHQSMTLPGKTQQATSLGLRQQATPFQTPKHWDTHFPWPNHPDTPYTEPDHQQTAPQSPEYIQTNLPSFGEQLEPLREPVPFEQDHSHPDHGVKASLYPDKQVKAISFPQNQTQAIKNRESSWCFNYIRPYTVEGGTVHNRTVNNIVSSVPQEKIKNDIRKQILLKRMKEHNHLGGQRLHSTYDVCILCASWIPFGCPHVNEMNSPSIAQLLAIPTPVPGSNIRMGIKFILQLFPQRASPDIYLPFQNSGMPHNDHSPVISSSSCSEPMPSESLLVSWLDYSHDKIHQALGRKPTGILEPFPRKMYKRKEESIESGEIFKAFMERYQMKRKEN